MALLELRIDFLSKFLLTYNSTEDVLYASIETLKSVLGVRGLIISTSLLTGPRRQRRYLHIPNHQGFPVRFYYTAPDTELSILTVSETTLTTLKYGCYSSSIFVRVE